MNWNTLLSPRRKSECQRSFTDEFFNLRAEFKKDYHRIISSASFRRLQDKTQVFPLDESDFIRTRLTHSLEVSSLSKSLGQNISESILKKNLDPDFTEEFKSNICDILLCAGLIHDIGNPPFGHSGEEVIRDWFRKNLSVLEFKGKPLTEVLTEQMQQDFYHFEGNAQALRLVSKLHLLVNEYGMNLTFVLLDTIIKYPVPSTGIFPHSGQICEKKMGYFYAEEELYRSISDSCGTFGVRHPLTYILEAADDISCRTADIEDAFKKGFISYNKLITELHSHLDAVYQGKENYPLSVLEQQYRKALERGNKEPKRYAVSNFIIQMQSYLIYCATNGFIAHYKEIMEGRWEHDLFYGTVAAPLIKALENIVFDHVFVSMQILKLEVAAGKIITYFLDNFIHAFISYDTDQMLGMMEEKLIHLISDNYKQIYHFYSKNQSENVRLYLRLLLVTDYISGMTDSFAKDLYQQLTGIE
ncbi:MAG: deoxyguanosinetriphosphate triphosphohydrolase [Lachnospiraceae bacterium]|nr:deoxyguanosinetriphosphate triphosphohydrolase [Lachnospiraceae bacterium]